MKYTKGLWRFDEESRNVIDQTNTVIAISGIAQPHGYVPPEDESWGNGLLVSAAPTMRMVLRGISVLGGNLPDEHLTARTGPNDAKARGLMYVTARDLALRTLAKLKALEEEF